MRSQGPGTAMSACQTMLTGCPATASRATLMSRSQLEPGKTMTAAFMGAYPSGHHAKAAKEGIYGLLALLEVLHERPRHQPVAQTGRDHELNRGATLTECQELDLG